MLPCQQFGSWIPDKRAPIRVGNSSLETICFWLVKLLVNLEKMYSTAVLWSFCRFRCSSLPQRLTYVTEQSDSKTIQQSLAAAAEDGRARPMCPYAATNLFTLLMVFRHSFDSWPRYVIEDCPAWSNKRETWGRVDSRETRWMSWEGLSSYSSSHSQIFHITCHVLLRQSFRHVTCGSLDGGWSLRFDDIFLFFFIWSQQKWIWVLCDFIVIFWFWHLVLFFTLLSVSPRLEVVFVQSFRGERGVVLPSMWPHTLLDNEEG